MASTTMEGGGIGDEDLRSRGLWYGWDQNSLGIGPPLDAVLLDDLGQSFETRMTSAHARLNVHALGILRHAMGEQRPNRDSAKPNSLLRSIKLWYLMSALLHSPDGRIKRRKRLALVDSGDRVTPAPMADGVHQGRGLQAT